MKYWRGYLTAAAFAAVTWVLMTFAKTHVSLVDMIYPYVTRMVQDSLAKWNSGVDFCVWQLIVMLLGVLLLASFVLSIVLKWNLFQWAGWVTAVASILFFLHTGVYGLNYYAGSLSEDIRLKKTEFTVTELAEATTYFRDRANELAQQVPRKEDGTLDYPTFREMAEQAGGGFYNLTYKKNLAVFSGSTLPVKELGWAKLYTSMGISGVTMGITGEAAVNPDTPVMALPFVMCHEMCHRMCIAQERDANLGAFLACDASDDPVFRYSGYFMAFRYCYNALVAVGTSTSANAANTIYAGIHTQLMADLTVYREYYAANQNEKATQTANRVNDTYIKVSGDESGVKSYGEVTDLLVSWYIQEIYLPTHQDEVVKFDPLDKNQVDLTETTRPQGE